MPGTNQMTSFYNNSSMSMTFMEIGIAVDRIDRHKPGKINFVIPILTPDADTSKMKESKVPQKSKSNILNDNKEAVDVSDIKVSNTIAIEIPRELCCIPNPVYDIDGTCVIDGSYNMSGTSDITITGNVNASGSISTSGNSNGTGTSSGNGVIGSGGYSLSSMTYNVSSSMSGSGSINMDGTISGSESLSGDGHINIDGTIKGTIKTELNKVNRYIEKGSKWLIAFIGGDMSMPCVVCRLPDNINK